MKLNDYIKKNMRGISEQVLEIYELVVDNVNDLTEIILNDDDLILCL